MNAFVINAFEFCRQNERRGGTIAVADLPRLLEDCADKSGSVQWALEGGVNKFGHEQFLLTVEAKVQLLCQRCLTPFMFHLASKSTLILAQDDGIADDIDELLEDEAVDVIVGSKAFDIKELIEDEALLALPTAAKHASCPTVALADVKKAAQESPFAGLGKLKQ